MAVFHCRSQQRVLSSSDKDAAISRMVIWEQVSICYSLLSITWPFSKVFINSFDTATLTPSGGYGSSTKTYGSATARSSLSRSSRGLWHVCCAIGGKRYCDVAENARRALVVVEAFTLADWQLVTSMDSVSCTVARGPSGRLSCDKDSAISQAQ